MPFDSAWPVYGASFLDREEELRRLLQSSDYLLRGYRQLWAIIGWRKIGKSSLLYEFERRLPDEILSVHVDCWSIRLSPYGFFHEFVKQLVNSFLKKSGLVERVGYVEKLAEDAKGRGDFLAALDRLRDLGIKNLSRAATALHLLEEHDYSYGLFSEIIDLPDRLALETGHKVIVIIDEFQELKNLERFKAAREHIGDIYALLRGHWQRQSEVNYIVAGSKITLLRNLILDINAPFFQHFRIMDLEPFAHDDAVELLTRYTAEAGRSISPAICQRIMDLVGTNPFYLQVIGEELCARNGSGEIEEDTLKVVLQEILFNSTGRLHLYFQRFHDQIVGRSSSLEAVLLTLTEDKRVADIADELRIKSGTASNWLGRLVKEDIAVQTVKGTYTIPDPAFRLWLKSQSSLQYVLPPLILGDETEQLIARTLMAQGVRLVYQSKASRGAFDLLALLDGEAIGLQCNKTSLPYYLPTTTFELMRDWGQRLDWQPVLALNVDGRIRFYRLTSLQPTDKHYRVSDDTPFETSLLPYVRREK